MSDENIRRELAEVLGVDPEELEVLAGKKLSGKDASLEELAIKALKENIRRFSSEGPHPKEALQLEHLTRRTKLARAFMKGNLDPRLFVQSGLLASNTGTAQAVITIRGDTELDPLTASVIACALEDVGAGAEAAIFREHIAQAPAEVLEKIEQIEHYGESQR